MIHAQSLNLNMPNSRIPILDELSRKKTLAPSSNAFSDLFGNPISYINHDANETILILGLGPFPSDWKVFLQTEYKQKIVYWLECPDFENQMSKNWFNAIPSHWEKCTLEDVSSFKGTTHIYLHTTSYRLFSKFWGPIIAKFQQKILGIQTRSLHNNTVILPVSEHNILTYELITACKEIGITPIAVPITSTLNSLIPIIKETNPSLLLSVNLHGLDEDGKTFQLLKAMNIPVVIWFVDNPWHILSKLRLPWWKEAKLFTTDISFVSELKSYGASSVHHLPLAAWESSMQGKKETNVHSNSTLFIGRTSFPNKKQFFSSCTVPQAILNEAYKNLCEGKEVPHFHWWVKKLGIAQAWPGKTLRCASFGAETLSLFRRKEWLTKASSIGLTVFGNNAWKKHLPNTVDLKNPIDYYNCMPCVISQANYNLNITSLLLPEALTQRHFDVWMFGGFLLTDITAGLKIFPKELTELISISNPNKLIAHIEYIEKDPSLRTTLMSAWKEHILKKHTYAIRIQQLLSLIHKM